MDYNSWISLTPGKALECYYCDLDIFQECDDIHSGSPITCQTTDPESSHYGNTCLVSHTGDLNEIL